MDPAILGLCAYGYVVLSAGPDPRPVCPRYSETLAGMSGPQLEKAILRVCGKGFGVLAPMRGLDEHLSYRNTCPTKKDTVG
jgi:hypothetical protein